jgi:hypothetical protein
VAAPPNTIGLEQEGKHPALLTARAVAGRLGVSLSTLNGWLATDQGREPADRRFTHHCYRGRKRLWTEEAFNKLEAAVERESEPGGVLGRWRSDCAPSTVTVSCANAGDALTQVLNWGRNHANGKHATTQMIRRTGGR